jgi:hypothetical protein
MEETQGGTTRKDRLKGHFKRLCLQEVAILPEIGRNLKKERHIAL